MTICIIRTNIQNTQLKYIVLGDGSHFYIPLIADGGSTAPQQIYILCTNSPPHVRSMHMKFRRLKYAHTCLMKFSVGDYYVKLGSSPGSIDSEFKHPYLDKLFIITHLP